MKVFLMSVKSILHTEWATTETGKVQLGELMHFDCDGATVIHFSASFVKFKIWVFVYAVCLL